MRLTATKRTRSVHSLNPILLLNKFQMRNFFHALLSKKYNNAEIQQRIKTLLIEFKNIFSDKLKAKLADIPPFDLVVDENMWETFRNRGPVRVQTEAKQAEIQKQTQQMLAAGIIEVSPASFYSQVHIAPTGGSRFCIYLRILNDATASTSWPIPNIQQMIYRCTSFIYIWYHGPNTRVPPSTYCQ
jgi:hypothetical protein